MYPGAAGRPSPVKTLPFRQCLDHGLEKCGNDLDGFVQGGGRIFQAVAANERDPPGLLFEIVGKGVIKLQQIDEAIKDTEQAKVVA